MSRLAELFSSAARTKVLETLHAQQMPVHLRLIGTLTGCPIRSIELAIRQLCDSGVVQRRKTARQIQYSLNHEHAFYPLLNQVLNAAIVSNILERSIQIDERAQAFIPFLKSTSQMIEKARRP